MGKRTPPFDSYPSWTTARFWSFVRAALRSAYRRWPPKYEVLREARSGYKGKGRQKYQYTCCTCKQKFKATEVEVDHKVPAGSLKDYEDLPMFVKRLFCPKEQLQVICKPCHKEKTKNERAAGGER